MKENFIKSFFYGSRDERVRAEINKIYRIAYLILMFGICFDLLLQFFSPDGGVRVVEYTVFMFANVLSLILMTRKGISDDSSRYAEADTFPRAYYLKVSVAGALLFDVLTCVLQARIWAGVPDLPLILLFTFASIFLFTAPTIYGLQYVCFRAAKKRRRELEHDMDENDQ